MLGVLARADTYTGLIEATTWINSQMHQISKYTTLITGNTKPAKKLKLASSLQPTIFFSQCIQPGIKSPAYKSMV